MVQRSCVPERDLATSLRRRFWRAILKSPSVGRKAHHVVVNIFGSSTLIGRRGRRMFLLLGGLEVRKATIAPGCFFGGTDVSIGRQSFVNRGCFFDAAGGITIGDDVAVGMRTMFITGSHEIGGPGRRAGRDVASRICVGDGVWIGAAVILLPGVSIGSGCVLASGSVVTSNCEADGVYAGSPARRLRDLPSLPNGRTAAG